jgi:hypothetical protein
MYGSLLWRRHASSISDADVVNDKVLARFIDAILVLIDDVKLDNLKSIWTRVSSLRQVSTNNFNLGTALRSSAKKSASR